MYRYKYIHCTDVSKFIRLLYWMYHMEKFQFVYLHELHKRTRPLYKDQSNKRIHMFGKLHTGDTNTSLHYSFTNTHLHVCIECIEDQIQFLLICPLYKELRTRYWSNINENKSHIDMLYRLVSSTLYSLCS